MLKIVGLRFGRLEVCELAYVRNCASYFRCKCDCGVEKIIKGSSMTSGKLKSCGCLRRDTARKMGEGTRKHGQWNTRTYHCWQAMKDRCSNENNENYHRYGGRGIRFCSRWAEFGKFHEDMGSCPIGRSIERIDNNGDYCKENCCWARPKQQMRNRRCTLLVDWNGEKKPLSELCETIGVNYRTAYCRYSRGESIEAVLSPEKRYFFRENNPKNRYLTYRGTTKRMKDWCEELNIGISTLSIRLSSGWSVERALSTPVKKYARQITR